MTVPSPIDRVQSARHWALLDPSGTAASVGDCAASQVSGDASGLLVPQVFAPPSATPAAAATSTDVRLASDIALGFVRSPFETAYYTGNTFTPAPRRPAREVTFLNRWKQPVDGRQS